MPEFIKKHLSIFILLVAIFLTIIVYKPIIQTIKPDLDVSWIFALHYLFINSIEHGKDIIFPYGPLGFLFFSIPTKLLPLTIVFHLATSFVFIWASLFLFIKSKENIKYILTIGFLVIYLLSMTTHLLYMLLFIPLILVLLRQTTREKRYFFFACGVAAFSIFLKIGFGFLAALTILSFSLYKLFENIKPANEKQILISNDAKGLNIVAEIFIGAAIYFTVLCGIWLLLYGNLNYLLDFLIWSKEVSFGYAQSMIFIHSKQYWLLGLFVLIFTFTPFFLKDKEYKFYHIVTILMTLCFIKYAIVRHIGYTNDYLFTYILIYLCFVKTIKKSTLVYLLCLFVLLSIFLGFSPKKNIENMKKIFQPSGPSYIKEVIFNYKKNLELNSELSKAATWLLTIPKEGRELIGNSTVEIFPWEETFVFANNLNWKPRFMFHSYMENTQNLDAKNASFFQTEESPEFILWHKQLFDFDSEYGRNGVIGIDRRYLFNDNPQTLYQIFNHYKPVANYFNAIIFQKSDKPNLPLRKEHPSENIKINEWTNVKYEKDNIILLRLNPQRTILGNIMQIIGFDVFAYIDYKFYDETIFRYKLPIITTLKDGIWINPYIYKFNIPIEAKRVKAIRIVVDNPKTLEKTIPAQWITIPYKKDFDMKFDFTNDNFLSQQQNPINKHKLLVLNKDANEKFYTIMPPKVIQLEANNKYILSLDIKSNTKATYYPKNFNCTITAKTNPTTSILDHTMLLCNNGELQKFNFIYLPKEDVAIEEFQINCYKYKSEIDFKNVELKEF